MITSVEMKTVWAAAKKKAKEITAWKEFIFWKEMLKTLLPKISKESPMIDIMGNWMRY